MVFTSSMCRLLTVRKNIIIYTLSFFINITVLRLDKFVLNILEVCTRTSSIKIKTIINENQVD